MTKAEKAGQPDFLTSEAERTASRAGWRSGLKRSSRWRTTRLNFSRDRLRGKGGLIRPSPIFLER